MEGSEARENDIDGHGSEVSVLSLLGENVRQGNPNGSGFTEDLPTGTECFSSLDKCWSVRQCPQRRAFRLGR